MYLSMKTTIMRAAAAGMFALVLMAGTFMAVPASTVHAESGSSHSTASIEELRELLLSLMQQLIALLEAQKGGVVSVDSDDNSCDDAGLTELEAEIFTNETVVQIELDGDKDVLITSADSRAEIIDAVMDEYPSLSEDEVDSLLTVEEEDRASRADDKDWADGDSSCDDDSEDEDEDEDEDDDDSDEDDDDSDEDDDEDEDEDD